MIPRLIQRNHASSSAAPTLVASDFQGWSSGSALSGGTLTTALNVLAGDWVLIALGWSDGTTITSIEDADGVAFSLTGTVVAADGRGGRCAVAYRKVTSSQSTYALNVVLSGGSQDFQAMCYQLRGADLTFNSADYVTGADTFSSNPLELALATYGPGFLIAVGRDIYTGQGAFTLAPSDFTIDHNDSINNHLLAAHWMTNAGVTETVTINDPATAQGGFTRLMGCVAEFNW